MKTAEEGGISQLFGVVSKEETTLIGRISDFVQSGHGHEFVV
jgi:hypothetical protein